MPCPTCWPIPIPIRPICIKVRSGSTPGGSNSITAPDQLRQRVAFALSEIFVVSENGMLQNHADALSSYYDMLLDNAFGNFRTLLEAVTLHPAMGLYLGMLGNNAGSIITGLHAE